MRSIVIVSTIWRGNKIKLEMRLHLHAPAREQLSMEEPEWNQIVGIENKNHSLILRADD